MKIRRNSLRHTYFRGVMRSLREVKNSLRELQEDAACRDALPGMRRAAGDIADLAMIHGYTGVESIASKICTAVRQVEKLRGPVPASFCLKIESGITAIKQVARIEDFIESQMTVERINRTAERSQRQVHERAQQLFDDAEKQPGDKSKPLFDINEFDSVEQLMTRATDSVPDGQSREVFDDDS